MGEAKNVTCAKFVHCIISIKFFVSNCTGLPTVETTLGKGEAESSNLSSSTIFPKDFNVLRNPLTFGCTHK